jgi:hypothetical protein
MSARHDASMPAPDPAGTTATTPLSNGRLAGRTAAYLALGVAWTAAWFLVLALAAALPIGLAGEPLADKPGIAALTSDLSELGAFLLVMPFLALLFGWVIVLMPFMAWPLAALSFVYVGRSLRPEYADEPLSTTTWSWEALGPITVTAKSMSLLPVRHSRFTNLLVVAYSLGWTPSFRMILACTPLGAAYLFTIGWALWPVTSPALVALCALVTLALAAWSIVLVVTKVRARAREWASAS